MASTLALVVLLRDSAAWQLLSKGQLVMVVQASHKEAIAHEILRLLLADQHQPSTIIDEAEKLRKDSSWRALSRFWKREVEAEDGPFEESDYVRGVAEMYLGMAEWIEGSFDPTLDAVVSHFDKAEQWFSYESDCYSETIACLAKGMLHKAHKEWDDAAPLLQHSLHDLGMLAADYQRIHDLRKYARCNGLAGRVAEMVAEVVNGQQDSQHVHLIPHVGQAAAGTLAVIATPVIGRQVDEIIIAKETYCLLALSKTLEKRASVPHQFKAHEEYFTLDVCGDSMAPAIEANDRILARATKEIKEVNGKIAVVLVGTDGSDWDSLVKRVHYKEKDPYVVLTSVNPRYRPRKFKRDSVQIQGEVIGILAKNKQQGNCGKVV